MSAGTLLTDDDWQVLDERHLDCDPAECGKAYQARKDVTEWLAKRDTALRETIARDIHAAKPEHITRDYTRVDQAYDDAARVARGQA